MIVVETRKESSTGSCTPDLKATSSDQLTEFIIVHAVNLLSLASATAGGGGGARRLRGSWIVAHAGTRRGGRARR